VTCAATHGQIPSLSFLNIGIRDVMSSGPGGIVPKKIIEFIVFKNRIIARVTYSSLARDS